MFRRGQWRVGWLGFEGDKKSAYITILAKDSSSNILLAKVTTAGQIPSGVARYAYGCILIVADSGVIYFNTGGATSCSFTVQGTLTAGTVTPSIMAVITATTDTSTAATGSTFAITAAQAYGKYFKIATGKTGTFTVTVPSAATLQALLGTTVGEWLDLIIYNGASTAATIAADSGATVTLLGTVALPSGKSMRIRFINTGSNTMDALCEVSA